MADDDLQSLDQDLSNNTDLTPDHIIEPPLADTSDHPEVVNDKVDPNGTFDNRIDPEGERVARNQGPIIGVGARDNDFINDDLTTSVEQEKISDEKQQSDPFELPMSFEDRFLISKARYNQDIFKSETDKKPLIRDKGYSLHTQAADKSTALEMMEIASFRGWEKMQVKGPEDFRRELWVEGTARGIDVLGYKPRDIDIAAADKRAEYIDVRSIIKLETSTNNIAKTQIANEPNTANEPDKPASSTDYETGVTGKVLETGNRPYLDCEDASDSFFVKLELEDGRDHTLWGVALSKVIDENELKVGDSATFKSLEEKPVDVPDKDKETGEIVTVHTYRRVWVAEGIDRHINSDIIPDNKDDSLVLDDSDRLGDRFKQLSPAEAVENPNLIGAASKLALIDAQLRSADVNDTERELTLKNATNAISDALNDGRIFDIEKLPAVSKIQDYGLKQIEKTAEKGAQKIEDKVGKIVDDFQQKQKTRDQER